MLTVLAMHNHRRNGDTQMTMTNAVWNDAGLLREYIATRFTGYLLRGATLNTAQRCNRLVKRLAALTGISEIELYQDLKGDAELADEA